MSSVLLTFLSFSPASSHGLLPGTPPCGWLQSFPHPLSMPSCFYAPLVRAVWHRGAGGQVAGGLVLGSLMTPSLLPRLQGDARLQGDRYPLGRGVFCSTRGACGVLLARRGHQLHGVCLPRSAGCTRASRRTALTSHCASLRHVRPSLRRFLPLTWWRCLAHVSPVS